MHEEQLHRHGEVIICALDSGDSVKLVTRFLVPAVEPSRDIVPQVELGEIEVLVVVEP